MKYLHWKKQIRRMYKQIEKDLHIQKLKVIIPTYHKIGIHIMPRLKTIIIPFEHMKKIQKDNEYKFSLPDITKAFIYHELGHYFQHMNNVEPIVGPKAKKFEYLRKSKNYQYSKEERYSFLETYAKLTMEVEKEAWEIGFKYYKSNEELYNLMKEQSLKTHEDSLKQMIEIEKKRLIQ